MIKNKKINNSTVYKSSEKTRLYDIIFSGLDMFWFGIWYKMKSGCLSSVSEIVNSEYV